MKVNCQSKLNCSIWCTFHVPNLKKMKVKCWLWNDEKQDTFSIEFLNSFGEILEVIIIFGMHECKESGEGRRQEWPIWRPNFSRFFHSRFGIPSKLWSSVVRTLHYVIWYPIAHTSSLHGYIVWDSKNIF